MSASDAARRTDAAARADGRPPSSQRDRGLDSPLLPAILAAARERPADPLLLTPQRSHDYGELCGCAATIVAALRKAGVRRGRRVAIYADAYDGFFAAMLGVWLAGGVVVPINTSLPGAEARRLVERAAPGAMLHDAALAGPAADAVGASCAPAAVLPLDDLLASAPPPAPDPLEVDLPDAGDPAMILFTSGTTGVPKGVCQTMAAVGGNATRVAAELALTPTDRIFINTPPYFTSGICHFLTLAAAGGSTYAESGFFFGEGLLDRLQERGCTGFGGAPAHLVRVVEPLSTPRRVPGLRFWVSSGDHLPEHTIRRTREMLTGVALFNMYGLTEVSGRLCILPADEIDRRPGSVGRPIADMRVTARDEAGKALPPGRTGELYVDGPLLMSGYLDDPQASAAALTPHGFRTGDFGHTDADGYVWVAGRRDDIFKRGGEKVSTVQIQQALLALPGILDCAVVAAADEVLGHVPVAFVVIGDEQPALARRLLKELRTVLPASSLPSRIVAVAAIPRTGSGKAVRKELLRLLGEGAGAGRGGRDRGESAGTDRDRGAGGDKDPA